MSDFIIHGMRTLLDNSWHEKQAVVIEQGKIRAIIPENMISHHLPAKELVFPEDYYLVPGLIDLHIHGAAGHDVMDADESGLRAISQALAEEGVTGFLATTMTADANHIEAAVANVARVRKSDSSILGVNLEGPFIAEEKIGAQNSKFLQFPDTNLIAQWQKISDGAIKLVTLAPELPGAIELIKFLVNNNIIAAIGHTNATYDETIKALNAGASYATHLFNCMRMMTQREPGATGALLLDRDVTAELIVDNVHLHPTMLELALKLKGVEHLVLVSDAMRAKGLGEGQFDLGGLNVIVKQSKATLADGRLAGSTLRLPQAIKNMLATNYCNLIEAINMATINPARLLGLSNKGVIDHGKDADLVVLTGSLDPVWTMRMGEILWQKNLSEAIHS